MLKYHQDQPMHTFGPKCVSQYADCYIAELYINSIGASNKSFSDAMINDQLAFI